MADGLPLSSPAESRRTIIEARIGNRWEGIASSTDPEFRLDHILLSRVILNQLPEFRLHPVPVDRWLGQKMLAVTNILETPSRHSTTSWVCVFDGCESISEVVPDSGVYVLLNARFLL